MDIADKAKKLVKKVGSRDPEEIAAQLGIIIVPVPFTRQKGIYKVIERNRFIFIKEDLCPEMRKIVLLHEIGHAVLHRGEAKLFQEFSIFDMRNDRREYEANSFAAEIALRMKKYWSISGRDMMPRQSPSVWVPIKTWLP